jgi:CheY-like chemotaxis protein
MKNFVAQGTRRLLVVEDNPTEQRTIVELLGDNDIEIATASTGTEAFETLLDRPFDCCVLDLRLPDMTGFELLDRIQQEPSLREVPVVVFTGKELSTLEQDRLRTAAKSVVLKEVQSPERLLDETTLFFHRVIADLPESKRQMLRRVHESNEALRGRKVHC